MIIDDEEVIRDQVAFFLEQCGYTALVACDGNEGWEVFQREWARIDLVLLDLSMPGLSGQEVLERIRALDSQIKVVVLTGYTEYKAQFERIAGFVQKPVMGSALVR